jgi:tRNA G18 (ribose-2'-O)-methylase SpoU
MPRLLLEDSADPRIAEYRTVKDAELWRARGLFIAEGRLVVRRALEGKKIAVRSVLVNPAANRQLGDVLDTLPAEIPIYVCAPNVLEELTGFTLHRGCLALFERPHELDFRRLLAGARLVVVLEALTDADNVGGVFRNAAAFGADAVILSPTCCDPLYRKALRTSMGTTLRVPFARADPWPQALDVIAQSGFTIAALTPREPASTLDEFAALARPRLALVVGGEGPGLTPAAETVAHARIRIPMAEGVDSLNVSVAAGIALSRLSRLT